MKSKKILIAGNWKMNHGPKDTEVFFETFQKHWDALSDELKMSVQKKEVEICLILPFVSLPKALELSKNLPITIAAQNVHWEKKGAFTGEISGPMLLEMGIDTVLIGHSERRTHFGETDPIVKKKAKSLLEQGFRVIVCIGETHTERLDNQTEAVLKKQLHALFGAGDLTASPQKLVLAYEPIWAIGTGLTATPTQAEDAHRIIGANISQDLPVLYGGSVTPENFKSLLECPSVDGGLIGGASLKPENLVEFIKIAVPG